MKLIEDTNFEGYLYLDHDHPPTQWNIARGGFDSLDNLPNDEQSFTLSVSMASMITNNSVKRLESELMIEVVRQQISPLSVSRLTGLFVFDDLDSLSQIWDSNRWGGHFEQKYLAEVGVSAKRSSRHDSNWVASMISADDGSLLPEWKKAAENYWKGLPKLGVVPVWERIVCGTFCIWSMHSKQSALDNILAIWPNSHNLLAYSMNAFAVNSHDGQIFPRIMIQEDTLSLSYYLRMNDALTPHIFDHIQELAQKKPQLYTAPVGGDAMMVPNLTGHEKKIPLTDTNQLMKLSNLFSIIKNGNVRSTMGNLY